jgi:hypothetical protein
MSTPKSSFKLESGYPGFKDFQDKEKNNYIGG